MFQMLKARIASHSKVKVSLSLKYLQIVTADVLFDFVINEWFHS